VVSNIYETVIIVDNKEHVFYTYIPIFMKTRCFGYQIKEFGGLGEQVIRSYISGD
jgi:hypothetical protein